MIRNAPRSLLAVAWGLFGLGLTPLAQDDDFSKVEIKAQQVAGPIYMLEGEGGNIGVSAGADGLLIVDDQFAPLAEKIKAALAKLAPGKLAFVLNTHWHGDHTGSNEIFGKEATIVAQTNVRRRLEKGSEAPFKKPPALKVALPVITFDQSLSIHWNGEEIKAVHFPPAHTDGDSVIFFAGSNVVHAGDLFFNGMFPFIDLDSGGDIEGYEQAVASLIKQLPEGAKVIPGHGPLGDKAALTKFHKMLQTSIELVRAAMQQGKSDEAIQKLSLPAEYSSYSWGFIPTDKWLAMVHRGLMKKK